MTGTASTIFSPSSRDDDPQHAVGRRVLRPDVEDHLLRAQGAAAGQARLGEPLSVGGDKGAHLDLPPQPVYKVVQPCQIFHRDPTGCL